MENKLVKGQCYRVNKPHVNFICLILDINFSTVKVRYINHSYHSKNRTDEWGRGCNYEEWCEYISNNKIVKILFGV